ncbi:hypothetical protein [Prosthecobacter sp.]|uniref:hypothetical protein n=1 Tax=Prosthecobacter sp. TaxID=1965333 RepID=UPI002ABBF61C|nr:hypothetical protein [Prosthecobacter sp.]MDZ4404481.1 hypothetical protein [Prosthecobacter sp.]
MLDPISPNPLVSAVKRLFSPFACFVWVLVFVMLYFGVRLVEKKFDVELLGGSGHLVEDARKAVQQNDWPAALQAIQKIPDGIRHKPEFLRVLADYLKGTRSDPALLSQVIGRLAVQGALNPEDFVWLCRDHLAEGRTQAARETLELIPAAMRSTLAFVEMELALLRQEGRQREAAEMERGMFEKFANDPGVALNKAVRDLDGTFPEIQRSARDRLWEMARRDDVHGLTAIRLLTKRTGHTRQETERLLQLADKHPRAAAPDRLEIISLIMRLVPEKREALLNEETERFSRKPAEIRPFAAWLAREKEFERMQKLLSKHASLRSEDMFILTAQGLAEQEHWTTLSEMLKKGRQLPVSSARVATWRALISKNLQPDNLQETRKHVHEAIRHGAVEKNTLAVLGAARLAEEWAMPDLALEAYLTLAEPGSRQEVELLEKCWQAAAALKDSNILEELARRLATSWPENRRFVLRYDYLRLLRGEKLELTVAKLSDADARLPAATVFLLEALKAYRMEDMFLVSYFLHSISETDDLTTGERAVYVGLMAACGEVSAAYQLAEKIHPELLLAGEKAFLERAL